MSSGTIGHSNSNVQNYIRHNQNINKEEKKERETSFEFKSAVKPSEAETRNLTSFIEPEKKAIVSNETSPKDISFYNNYNEIPDEPHISEENISKLDSSVGMFKNDNTSIALEQPKKSIIDKLKSQTLKLFKPFKKFTKFTNSIKTTKNVNIKKPTLDALNKFNQIGRDGIKIGRDGINKLGINKNNLINKPTKKMKELGQQFKALLNRGNPLFKLPENLKKDKAFMETLTPYKKASAEARKAAVAYNTSRGIAIAKSFGKAAIGVGLGTAIGSSLGALLHLLTNKNKSTNVHVTPEEIGDVNHNTETAGSQELPNLRSEPIDFSTLKSENPEIADQLQNIFGNIYPGGDFNSKTMTSESKEAADSLVKDFIETYNSVPNDQREQFLSVFSQEASQVINVLENDSSNKFTNTSDIWLKAQSVSEPINECTNNALNKIQTSSGNYSTTIQEDENLTSTPNKAIAMGAAFGASVGAAVIALKATNKNNNILALDKTNVLKKKAELQEKTSVKDNLYNELVAPHIENQNKETEVGV